MHPNICELPPPPPGKTGWPWTTECPRLPDKMPNGNPWPRISIVTPSFNQGAFIEETIRSVLLQGYQDLEYIIIDGGSTDDSVEIIKRYSPWLTYWVSEADRGQAHALNKGLARCTGDLFQWINSDDLLAPGALGIVGKLNQGRSEVAGSVTSFSDTGISHVTKNTQLSAKGILRKHGSPTRYSQPGVWLLTERLRAVGGLDEGYHYAFDIEMMLRYLLGPSNFRYTSVELARFRLHPDSKSIAHNEKFSADAERIAANAIGKRRFAAVSDDLQAWAGMQRWKREIAGIRALNESKWVKVCHLLAGVVRDPQIRISKLTISSLWHCLRKK